MPPMRRRTVLQRVEQEAELWLLFFRADAERGEDLSCTSARWIRTETAASSQPFSARS